MHSSHIYEAISLFCAVAIVLFSDPQGHFRQSSRATDDTCQSFIHAVEEADETMDQFRPQLYNHIAEDMYASLNSAVIKAGLKALSLPQSPKTKSKRTDMVIWQCRANINQTYHDAVAEVYVKLRMITDTLDAPNSN